MIQGFCVDTLHLSTHFYKLKTICGDIGNTFLQAYTKEKVCTRYGPELGEYRERIFIIVKSVYGLITSAVQWRNLFADTLQIWCFCATKYDRDVWMRRQDEDDGYLCSHLDNFKTCCTPAISLVNKIKGNVVN